MENRNLEYSNALHGCLENRLANYLKTDYQKIEDSKDVAEMIFTDRPYNPDTNFIKRKSNLAFLLALELQKMDIPFLVIDWKKPAEREGFEPSNPFELHAFQACALSQATRPLLIQNHRLFTFTVVRPRGFEPPTFESATRKRRVF